MYYNEAVIRNLIENIYKKRVKVQFTFGNTSAVETLSAIEDGIVKTVSVKFFEISVQEWEEKSMIPFLKPEQRELFEKYDGKLWTILHEIGHVKTIKGLSQNSIVKNLETYKENKKRLNRDERKVAYRDLPAERRADKWAYNWALKHPKECEFASHNLRISKY